MPGGIDPDDSDDSSPAPTLEMSQQEPLAGISSSPLKESPEPRRSSRTKSTHAPVSVPVRRRVKDRWIFEPVPLTTPIPDGELSLSNQERFSAPKSFDAVSLSNQERFSAPKSSGAVSLSNRGMFLAQHSSDEVSVSNPGVSCASFSLDAVSLPDSRIPLSPSRLCRENGEKNGEENGEKNGETLSLPSHDRKSGETIVNETVPASRNVFLTPKVLRRILLAKESLFKFGTFVPKNETEALRSPERHRWIAGRDLEWLRMGNRGTFERDWTWNRIMREFPHYLKSDIGFLFYVFDYKFSGEHRVRLVFDGSRQSPTIYTETYAPAARQESVRLFHIVLVEECYCLGQYDVPQAFLLAPIDNDIFVYPPKGQSEYPGQVLKLKKALYGGKQSAYLWFQMINAFILELGFEPSPLDSCFYKRSDAILLLYCDDLRIGASASVLQSLKDAFFHRFEITTAPCTRFLGMDTLYDRDQGYLKLSMESYIDTTVARFDSFDLSCGFPFRELVGCLLWITLSVLGPELLRVKDLARRSNTFQEKDYLDAMKVLKRISARKHHGIVIFRNAAGREVPPESTRPSLAEVLPLSSLSDDTGDWAVGSSSSEVVQKSLCQAKVLPSGSSFSPYHVPDDDDIEIHRVVLAVNPRYNLIVFGDASFAIGELKQSVSGYVVYLNGVPLLWGSLKQTIVVDSSCSAEYVAASIACKQLLQAENMLGFLGFSCPKPYRIYTDSMACLHIATNPAKLGNVRHLQIRYHRVRCFVSFGDATMHFCITEAMVADLFTKIVAGAQDLRLTARFYSLLPNSADFVLGLSTVPPSFGLESSSAYNETRRLFSDSNGDEVWATPCSLISDPTIGPVAMIPRT
jgi:hypothetical protein